MSTELLFASKIDISGKTDYIPVVCEQFYRQSLQHVKEETHCQSSWEATFKVGFVLVAFKYNE